MGPLDSYLPYLLNRAGARIAASFSEEVRRLGATLQMWRVLAALREHDGRRMGDLSETTSIEVSTLTRLVDNMEKKGLVARGPGGVHGGGSRYSEGSPSPSLQQHGSP